MKNPKMFYAIKESDKMSTSGVGGGVVVVVGRCRHSFDTIRKAQRKSRGKKNLHMSRLLWRETPLILSSIMCRRHSLSLYICMYIYLSITKLAALNDASASINMTNFARAKSKLKTRQIARLADTLCVSESEADSSSYNIYNI